MQVPRQSEPKSDDGRKTAAEPAGAPGPEAVSAVSQEAREALAEHLRRCPYLPPALATTLADDVLSTGLAPGNGQAAPSGTRLPLRTAQQVIFGVSRELRGHLAERHDLPPELADEMALHGRERALTRTMSPDDPKAEIEALVADLAAEALLTPTLLLRGLCLGRLDFFRAAMARLAGLPLDEAARRVLEDGPEAFAALYETSGLPAGLYRAFRGALEVIRSLPPEEARDWQRTSTNAIISRLVNEYQEVCPEDLEHVLSQLSRRLAEPPPNGTPLNEVPA